MRVLMLNYEFPPLGGGGGHASRCLLERYAQIPDLEVRLVTSGPEPGVSTERLSERIIVTRLGVHKRDPHLWTRREAIEWIARARTQCRRLAKNPDYRVVHAWSGFPTGWLCRLVPMARPYVVSLRGSDVPGRNPRFVLEYALLAPLVLRPIWRNAAALVACSQGLRRRALAFEPSLHVDVIPNGVDLGQFRPPETSGRPTNGGPLTLLTVGRLAAAKRLHLILGAVERLRAAGCRVSLTVVGDGPLNDRVREEARCRRLDEAVTFCGWIPSQRMPELYRRHDLYVSASAQEGMSNAMLEAMASGLPIVTTRCEGTDELVADNGVVVERAEAEDLACVIGELGADRSRLTAMARAARRRAEGFTWDAVAQQYLALYERIACR